MLETTNAAAHQETIIVGYFCVFISRCVPPPEIIIQLLKIPNLYNSVIFKK